MEHSVPILDIKDLSVEFRTRSGVVHALENVSLDVCKGEIVGVVGESGSGKSVSALTAMGILDPAGCVTAGSITLGGLDVLGASESVLQATRGHEVSMIFQSPRTALNPIRTVGKQIGDVLRRRRDQDDWPVRNVVFEGERFDVASVRRWRERILSS